MNISDYESTNIYISRPDNLFGEYDAESDKVNNLSILEFNFPSERKEAEQDQKQALSFRANKATNQQKVSHKERLAPKRHTSK